MTRITTLLTLTFLAQVAHASQPYCMPQGNNGYVLVHPQGNNQTQPPGSFPWTEAYDQNCDPIEIWAHCTDDGQTHTGPLTAYTEEWTGPVAQDHTCPGAHSQVMLDEGEHAIECQKGRVNAPFFHTYSRDPSSTSPLTPSYGVVCYDGEIVDLGADGGAFQVIIDPELQTGRFNFFAGISPIGQIGVGAAGTISAVQEWKGNLSLDVQGFVTCPTDGTFEIYFTDFGAASTNVGDFVEVSCPSGDWVELSNIDWSVQPPAVASSRSFN